MDEIDKRRVLLEKTTKASLAEVASNQFNKSKPVMQSIKGYEYDIALTDNGIELFKRETALKKKNKYACPFIISVWPLAFQSAFKKLFAKTFPQYTGNGDGSVIFTGSVNYNNILYQRIERLTSTDQLPDILITYDFNTIYHRGFKRCLFNNRNFETLDFPMHSIYSNTNFKHPSKLIGMLASDALVMVIDRSKFEKKQAPREWYELLNHSLTNGIVLCGDRDYFCNTFYYHFVKNYGFEALKALYNNTLARIHPEEMLQSIHDGNTLEASVYVMPYSYAKNIQIKFDYQIIYPEDGAMLIPIQMLVKKGTYEKNEDIIRFLTGEQLGAKLEQYGFIATNPDTCKQYPGTKLNWIGWDFIENGDLYKTKEKIREMLVNK
jgi:hypothetical protein